MVTSEKDKEILEQISAIFDGEGLPEGRMQEFDADQKRHLQNWSLIGSAMRHELPPKVDLSFADKVMAEVVKTEPDLVDQDENAQLPVHAKRRFHFNFKKLGQVVSQLAVAASVAAVTVVGWQTYTAGDAAELSAPVSNASMGPVSGLSLASYQNDSRDHVLNFSNIAQHTDLNAVEDKPNAELLRQMQQKELERINNYVRGYVLHSAAE